MEPFSRGAAETCGKPISPAAFPPVSDEELLEEVAPRPLLIFRGQLGELSAIPVRALQPEADFKTDAL